MCFKSAAGPLVTAPKGGYLSGMESGNGAFKATYNFDDASLATIATAGTSRIMSWQVRCLQLLLFDKHPISPETLKTCQARRTCVIFAFHTSCRTCSCHCSSVCKP